MIKKKIFILFITILFASQAHAEAEQQKSKTSILKECYASSRTMLGLMPREVFETCVSSQKGPLSKQEYQFFKLEHQKGLISKTDLFRLKNHYRVTPDYYKVYLGTFRDWQLEEWRRRDTNGYFEAIYDQVETEIPKLFQSLEITLETPPKVAIQKLVDHLIRSAEYNMTVVPDTQLRGKVGDVPKVFLDKDKKLFTGYERKGQYELDEIFKVLIEKRGVCAGFSIILSNFFDRLHIVNAPLLITYKNSLIGHVAVVVKIDDNEYIVDPVLEQNLYQQTLKSKRQPTKKNKLFYTIDEYREIMKQNNYSIAKIDRAELEHGYARNEQFIMSMKEKREKKQKNAAQQ